MKQSIDNIRRADDAMVALEAFGGRMDTLDSSIADLIANLLHLADMKGLDSNLIVKRAMNYYDAESCENLIEEGDNDPT